MSSSDFVTNVVFDNRLAGLSNEITYSIFKGAQYNTAVAQPANSATTSVVQFNVVVPSLETILSRNVLYRAKITIKINVTAADEGIPYFQWGFDTALQSFPLNRLISTMQCSINGCTVDIQSQDAVSMLLRMLDKETLCKYNGMCPNMNDNYYYYSDSLNSNNSPLASWQNTDIQGDYSPRGSWNIIGISKDTTVITPGTFASTVAGSDGLAHFFCVQFESTEPLLGLSPFTLLERECIAPDGTYGIQNMNFIFNQMTNCSRVLSTCSQYIQGYSQWASNGASGYNLATSAVTLQEVTEAYLDLIYLTPPPSLSAQLTDKCVLPYYKFQRTITQNLGAVAAGATNTVLVSQTVQFNSVADKYICYVRKALGNQSCFDSDHFFPIKKANVTFNAQSGLFNSYDSKQLWQLSVDNGCNLTYIEWFGLAQKYDAALSAYTKQVPTVGGMLVLNGEDLSLPDWLAPGCLGNYNWQLQLTIDNTSAEVFNGTTNTVEMVVWTMQSGLYVSNKGESGTYVGILQRIDVADAVQTQKAYSKAEVRRMVGGSVFTTLKSIVGKVLPHLPKVAKMALSHIEHPYAKVGAEALGALGYGQSGGGESGGAMSGGKRMSAKMASKMM